MVRAPTCTARLSSRSRLPSQLVQRASPMNCAYQRLARSERASLKRRARRGMAPSQGMSKWPLPVRPSQRTLKLRSPVPQSTASRCFLGSLCHGFLGSMRSCWRICPRKPADQPVFSETSLPQLRTAPSSMLSDSSGITSSGSISTLEPRPLQSNAHALGTVEGEALGRELGKGDAAAAAGHLLRVDAVALLVRGGDEHALAHLERGLHGLRQSRRDASLDDHAIDDGFDGVLAALVQRLGLLGEHHLAVHAQAHVAGASRIGEELPVLALAIHENGRHQHHACVRRRAGELLGDLLRSLALDRLAALVAVLDPHPCPEHAQVVADLGDGSHRRARVGAGGLLLDGDGGGESTNGVVVGLLHLAQELARVGGERLHVAPLALGRRACRRPGRTCRIPRRPSARRASSWGSLHRCRAGCARAHRESGRGRVPWGRAESSLCAAHRRA